MKPVSVGIIGCGRWGIKIRTALRMHDAVQTAWIVTQRDGICSAPGSNQHFRLPGDWRQVLDRADVDAVVVATPAPLHEEMAIEVLRRGLPLFLEKPAALSLAGTERIARAWEDAGKPALLVDHIYLFHPTYEALRQIVGERPGDLDCIATVFGGPMPERPDCPLLWDWGPHAAAVALDLASLAPDGFDRKNQVAWRVGRWPADHRFAGAAFEHDRVSWQGGDSLVSEAGPSRVEFRPPTGTGVLPPLTRALDLFIAAVRRDPEARADRRLGMDLPLRVAREIERQAAVEATCQGM